MKKHLFLIWALLVGISLMIYLLLGINNAIYSYVAMTVAVVSLFGSIISTFLQNYTQYLKNLLAAWVTTSIMGVEMLNSFFCKGLGCAGPQFLVFLSGLFALIAYVQVYDSASKNK